jgi:dethiobiotin synthetase
VNGVAAVAIVTGTGTEVGKTVTTAALAAAANSAGLRVVVVKPVQTGLSDGEPGDVADVERLAGPVETHELLRLPDPLAPDTAARISGVMLPPVAQHAAYVASLARRGDVDVVVVEGAGGLLVHLDSDGGDLTTLASALVHDGLVPRFVVVASAGLGTLNHSALTAEALRHRGLDCAGFVIGSWPQPPDEPDLAMRCNLEDLPVVTEAPLLGVLPAGAGALSSERFRELAPGWVASVDALWAPPGGRSAEAEERLS